MESNHGLAVSPFSGHVQAQRGQIERWSFTMRIRRMTRAESQQAVAFFLNLEGNLNTFRMGDPAAPLPLGPSIGTPVLTADFPAGARTLTVSGWKPNVPGILKAGDWIQIGDHLTRLRADSDSNAAGQSTLDIWPKLHIAAAAASPVITRHPKGIFRFTSEMPAFDITAELTSRRYTFSLTGSQEILTPSE